MLDYEIFDFSGFWGIGGHSFSWIRNALWLNKSVTLGEVELERARGFYTSLNKLPAAVLERLQILSQHELAVTLREIGRVERTLFIVDWLLDADVQRRANTGLNKGEAHHALIDPDIRGSAQANLTLGNSFLQERIQ